MNKRLLAFAVLILAPVVSIGASGLLNTSPPASPPANSDTAAAKTNPSANPPPPAFDVKFMDLALAFTAESAKAAKGTFFIQNSGAVDAVVNFSIKLAKGKANASIIGEDRRIGGPDVKPFELLITVEEGELPLSGFLKMEATSVEATPRKKETFVGITLNPPATPPPPSKLVLYPLAVASVITVISLFGLWLGNVASPLGKMGSPTWSFKDSWATNVTVASTTLVTLLTYSSPPDKPVHFSKTGYSVLSFLFAAVVGLAPVVYNLLRREVDANDAKGNDVVQFQGFVGVFLLACLLTLWGVTGQLVTLHYHLDEIGGRYIAQSIITLFKSLAVAVGILILGYACFSIFRTVKRQKVDEQLTLRDAVESIRVRAARGAAAGAGERVEETSREGVVRKVDVKPVLPEWPLL